MGRSTKSKNISATICDRLVSFAYDESTRMLPGMEVARATAPISFQAPRRNGDLPARVASLRVSIVLTTEMMVDGQVNGWG